MIATAVGVVAANEAFFSPRPAASSPGSSSASPLVTNLIDTPSRTIGAGPAKGILLTVTVPPGSTDVHLSGWVNVTKCGSDGNCYVNVDLLTPANWSGYLQGLDVGFVWCSGPSCNGYQNNSVATPDLSSAADGTTLDLAIFNTDIIFGQTVQANVDLVYTT